MLKRFLIAVFAVIICCLPQVTKAGPEGEGSTVTSNPEPVRTKVVRLEWKKHWGYPGHWVYQGGTINDQNGENYQCQLCQSAPCPCELFDWRADYAVDSLSDLPPGTYTPEYGEGLIEAGAMECCGVDLSGTPAPDLSVEWFER